MAVAKITNVGNERLYVELAGGEFGLIDIGAHPFLSGCAAEGVKLEGGVLVWSGVVSVDAEWCRDNFAKPAEKEFELAPLIEQSKEPYSCNVLNCGGGDCVHAWIPERCDFCSCQMVIVKPTGFKFCSGRLCD
ncbi:hypothetical protein [Vibrio owensii]|uniref:hypothetical protein n=1 Tax=Vibrio owensii TaxID=696485 RepID=UPI0018F203DE|nr:hypothetical protein [Vibrio owensii]